MGILIGRSPTPCATPGSPRLRRDAAASGRELTAFQRRPGIGLDPAREQAILAGQESRTARGSVQPGVAAVGRQPPFPAPTRDDRQPSPR